MFPGMQRPRRFPLARCRALASAVLAIALPATALAAATPKQLGVYGDWSAYTLTEGKAKTCYIVSRPKSTEPKGAKRGEASILVSHKQGDKTKGEININAGYNYKKGSAVELTVEKTKFTLVTFDKPGYLDSAFAPEGKDEAIIAALEKSKKAVVKGGSDKGTETTDTYSLNGIGPALKAMGSACK